MLACKRYAVETPWKLCKQITCHVTRNKSSTTDSKKARHNSIKRRNVWSYQLKLWWEYSPLTQYIMWHTFQIIRLRSRVFQKRKNQRLSFSSKYTNQKRVSFLEWRREADIITVFVQAERTRPKITLNIIKSPRFRFFHIKAESHAERDCQ